MNRYRPVTDEVLALFAHLGCTEDLADLVSDEADELEELPWTLETVRAYALGKKHAHAQRDRHEEEQSMEDADRG